MIVMRMEPSVTNEILNSKLYNAVSYVEEMVDRNYILAEVVYQASKVYGVAVNEIAIELRRRFRRKKMIK